MNWHIDLAFFTGMATGVFCTVAMVVIALSLIPGPYKNAEEAIAECERNLPRTEHCVVSAVPKKEQLEQ